MGATKEAAPKRRTQEDRRETTIRKLMTAAIDVLVDVGYAGATTQGICERAELSQGALFRHFESREALMVAVAKEVGARAMLRYEKQFESLRKSEEPLSLALRLLRTRATSRVNQAWYELLIASRTNKRLRAALRPVAVQYFEDLEALAAEILPELKVALGPLFGVLVDTILCAFDGEAIHRFAFERPREESQRIELLVQIATALGITAGTRA